MTPAKPQDIIVRPFDFECYGVNVRLNGNVQSVIDEAASVALKALLNDTRPVITSKFDYIFVFDLGEDGRLSLTESGEVVGSDSVPEYLFHFFNSLVSTHTHTHTRTTTTTVFM